MKANNLATSICYAAYIHGFVGLRETYESESHPIYKCSDNYLLYPHHIECEVLYVKE